MVFSFCFDYGIIYLEVISMYDEELDEDDGTGGISFARKYRSYDLDGYIGNSDVKDTVIRYMKPGVKRPQTILLHGNSGCGKTTLARILMKGYRCENPTEHGACGECMSCQLFDEYIKTGKNDMLTDVYEIDASEQSGKRDIGAMLESMEYPAMGGDWKVYLIDEAHLLREDAMGRLLKTIEEPPDGVLILICTTNPEKLLDTVRNRCQLKLGITKPTSLELMNHLKRVCDCEGKIYDLEGLRMLVARADNVVRDALNNLETVLSTRGNATAVSVSEQFRQVNDKIIYDFYDAYFKDDYVGYSGILYKIKTRYDFNQFLVSLVNFTIRGIYILNSIEVDGLTTEEIKSTLALFSKFSVRELSRVLSELRRMNQGSIEANLLSFIYCKNDMVETGERVVVKPEESGVEEEQKFRNNNLEKIQQARLEEGQRSAESKMGMATFEDLSSMFNLEKVE